MKALRLALTLCCLNAGVILLGVWAHHAPPTQQVRVAPREQGLILFGRNVFGLQSLRIFKNWGEFSDYIHEQQLVLPALSYAWSAQAQSVHTHSLGPTQPFKVTWLGQSGEGVLFAPDAQSAQIFSTYLKYQSLSPSYLGFSLPLGE